jgi:RNA-directed DNA polymerase
LGNLSTPKSVQKLQMALHAKAKAEAGYRFYALYDKISREDILAHAWAQCRSNKGAPGVDGQDFADVEAYGVQRWLGELALALRGCRRNDLHCQSSCEDTRFGEPDPGERGPV